LEISLFLQEIISHDIHVKYKKPSDFSLISSPLAQKTIIV